MDRPGWIGKIADLERQMAVVMRVAWAVVGFVFLAVGGSVVAMVLK
jgi:hypothetical protein